MSEANTSDNIFPAYLDGIEVVGCDLWPDGPAPDKEQAVRVRAALYGVGIRKPITDISEHVRPETDLALALRLAGCKPDERILPWAQLDLSGRLLPTWGVVSAAEYARDNNLVLICSRHDRVQAEMVPGVWLFDEYDLSSVMALCGCINDDFVQRAGIQGRGLPMLPKKQEMSWEDIKGGEATQVAVFEARLVFAQGKPLLLMGPAGSGRTMVARRLTLDLAEGLSESPDVRLQTAKIHSASGLLSHHISLPAPFRAPHHTCSSVGVYGGGHRARPGEASLAHGGVLFLDEAPEFQMQTLERVKMAYSDLSVNLHRAGGIDAAPRVFPADFQLVAASNPCPCGYAGSEIQQCNCDSQDIVRYHARIERAFGVDFFTTVHMPPIRTKDLR